MIRRFLLVVGGPPSAPLAVHAARVAGTLFLIFAAVRVIVLGERFAWSMSAGYYFWPAAGAIVCGLLGASLRRGSLRYRALALNITVFSGLAFIVLRTLAVARHKGTPSAATVAEHVLFAAALLPLLTKYPSRIHLRIGYVVGGLWVAFEVLSLIPVASS
jgi:hypothetical protein